MAQMRLPPQEGIDEFVGAAHGDFQRVRDFIQEYPDLVHARASWDESGIEAAAQTGQVEIADYLLAHGAPLDICTAVMLGNTQDVDDLLAGNPDLIHATGAHGIPLLYFPVIRGNWELAEHLRERGADINAGSGSNTPLHGAILFDQPQMVHWLLRNGAGCQGIDYNGKTPLALAEENHHKVIVRMLREHGCQE